MLEPPSWYDQWKIVSEENAQLRAEVERLKNVSAANTSLRDMNSHLKEQVARLRAENERLLAGADESIKVWHEQQRRIAAKDAALDYTDAQLGGQGWVVLGPIIIERVISKVREARKA